jgi:hypothetical protein
VSDVLVLGGYGAYGSRISRRLAEAGYSVCIAGRNIDKARNQADLIRSNLAGAEVVPYPLDLESGLPQALSDICPAVVIDASGAFGPDEYQAAWACIDFGCHYIDIADARARVCGIGKLDKRARELNVVVISGASSLPVLSSAVIEKFESEFAQIEEVDIGISAAQRAPPGVATTRSILSYLGRPIGGLGDAAIRYGWQGVRSKQYPRVGRRWLSDVDVPDLQLFPGRYRIGKVRCGAGLELGVLHFSLWLLSWLVRLFPIVRLIRLADIFCRLAPILNPLGTGTSVMHVALSGTDKNGLCRSRNWFVVASDSRGPEIPCIPAVILARKLLDGTLLASDAMAGIGLVKLEEYVAELEPLPIQTFIDETIEVSEP